MSFQQTTVRTTTISPSASIKQFITPEEMLQRLTLVDLPKCQCDESSQEQILLEKLIAQYKIQIATRTQEIIDAEKLLEIRDRLYLEMEHLKREREALENNIASELNSLENQHMMRMTGIKSQAVGVGQEAELLHIRQANGKLRLKLKDLSEYIMRMQTYNQRLEMSRTTLPPRVEATTDLIYTRAVINQQKVLSRLAQQDEYTRRMEERIRRMEEESITKVKMQEDEINRRNIQRLNQIRLTQAINSKNYIPQEPIITNSRGLYDNRAFFPQHDLYTGLK